jgi:excisionase family DNA binding protein
MLCYVLSTVRNVISPMNLSLLACIIRLLVKNQFVTLEQAARDLCVHIGTMRRWVREGRVQATKIGRKYLIPIKVYEELVAEGGVEHVAVPKPTTAPAHGQVELLPLWLQFNPTWYRRLYLISQKCSLSAAETLTRGMELVLKEHQDQKKNS